MHGLLHKMGPAKFLTNALGAVATPGGELERPFATNVKGYVRQRARRLPLGTHQIRKRCTVAFNNTHSKYVWLNTKSCFRAFMFVYYLKLGQPTSTCIQYFPMLCANRYVSVSVRYSYTVPFVREDITSKLDSCWCNGHNCTYLLA